MLTHRVTRIAPVLVTLLVSSCTVAFAQCPTTTMTCSMCFSGSCFPQPPSPSETQAPTGSLNCPSEVSVYNSMDFNLATGVFNARGQGGTNYHGEATVSAKDLYTVAGAPAGTPMTITAKLHITGATGGGTFGGTVAASLTSGASTQSFSASSTVSCSPPFGCLATSVPVNTDVVLSIACLAGQPFEMTTFLSARCRYDVATANATLSFANLPAGTVILSCQGFTSSSPTAVSTASWGRIKQIYR